MKLRVLIVILCVAALFSGVVLWRVDRFVYGDRMKWAEAQARSQISSLNQAVRSEIQSSRRMLAAVTADTFKKDKTNWNSFQPYYVVALMTNQGGALSISQMSARADSPAAQWTPAQLGQYIGFMGKELEKRGMVLLRAFKDPQKNRHVAIIFADGGHAYILVGSGGNFQSLIESQRGSMNSFAIVASDGLTISHGTPEYIGTVMGDSTLMKEIKSSGSAQGIGTYIQGKRPIFGMYEQIAGTSAYILSTVPTEQLMRGRLSLAWQFVFLALGLGLIGTAAYVWFERRTLPAVEPYPVIMGSAGSAHVASSNTAGESLSKAATASMSATMQAAPPAKERIPDELDHDVVTQNSFLIAPMAPKSPPPPAYSAHAAAPGGPVPAPAVPPDWQQEKSEAYRQVAAAMGQEMRAPLASILGFSQMVLSKTHDPEVVQAVESILREARSSRDVLEKLVTFSGERSVDKVESKIEGPIVQALRNLDARLQQKGVSVEKDFKQTSPWPMSQSDLVKVFENIFENAIEAMERMHDKSLRISTWENTHGLNVRITDTGEGIDRENLGKVFDPFFTTRSYAHHVGLGLPVAAGVLKEHRAHVRLHSERAKGTTVEIVFAPGAADAVASSFDAISSSPVPELKGRDPEPTDPPEAEFKVSTTSGPLATEKLTDVNVDSLLELLPEEAPLEFLSGPGMEGFENVRLQPAKPPSAPPVAPPIPPPAPKVPEAQQVVVVLDQVNLQAQEITLIKSIEDLEKEDVSRKDVQREDISRQGVPHEDMRHQDVRHEEIPSAPPVSAEKQGAPEMPPVIAVPAQAVERSHVVIDRPTASIKPPGASALDDYKVQVRRPGKRS